VRRCTDRTPGGASVSGLLATCSQPARVSSTEFLIGVAVVLRVLYASVVILRFPPSAFSSSFRSPPEPRTENHEPSMSFLGVRRHVAALPFQPRTLPRLWRAEPRTMNREPSAVAAVCDRRPLPLACVPAFARVAFPPQLSGRPTEENHAYTVLSPLYNLTRTFSITPLTLALALAPLRVMNA